jgi:hypothetical protein
VDLGKKTNQEKQAITRGAGQVSSEGQSESLEIGCKVVLVIE